MATSAALCLSGDLQTLHAINVCKTHRHDLSFSPSFTYAYIGLELNVSCAIVII